MSAKDDSFVPSNLEDLCAFLHAELSSKGIHEMASINVSRIHQAMTNYLSNLDDWQRYRHFDEGRYTRNLVDSGNGKFNLMILCWPEGIKSPIHDHAGSHCLMKVIEGELTESLYSWPEKSGPATSLIPSDQDSCPPNPVAGSSASGKAMNLKKKTVFEKDQVAYIHDKIGLHRISNASDKPAVSLHLYCPPYEACKTFDEKTSVARGSGRCLFYSEGGVVKSGSGRGPSGQNVMQ